MVVVGGGGEDWYLSVSVSYVCRQLVLFLVSSPSEWWPIALFQLSVVAVTFNIIYFRTFFLRDFIYFRHILLGFYYICMLAM